MNKVLGIETTIPRDVCEKVEKELERRIINHFQKILKKKKKNVSENHS
jgi:hypothetical protein